MTAPSSRPPDGREPQLSDVVSGFVLAPSLQFASQEAKDGPSRSRIESSGAGWPGRSLISSHPIILRDLPPNADSPPTQTQLSRLYRSLTQRDLAILQALYDYRYLNTLQVKELFFPSIRSCQMRLQALRNHGLIYRWLLIETPGVRRRHSLILISQRGARVLANLHGDEPRTYVERSHDARDHCWHAIHDLEANQFFVRVASEGREHPEQGLLVWFGEEHVRAERRRAAQEDKRPIPTPDGTGIYLVAGARIIFDLEWDRATESLDRVREKIRSYVGYFEHYREAEQHHVLFVVPSHHREAKLQQSIWRQRPRFRSDSCCRFWTTTLGRLRESGPLAAIWLPVEIRNAEPPSRQDTRLRTRIALNQLTPVQLDEGPIDDCIGKPAWWERRPGGGQAA